MQILTPNHFKMKNIVGKSKGKFKIPGIRYVFAIGGFLGLAVNFGVRTNLNVAIVAMVNNTAINQYELNTSNFSECKTPTQIFNSSSFIPKPIKDGEFVWSPQEQGIILGSFYYGYLVLQVPGGRMAEMYSGKWVFGLGTFISAVLSLLTPMIARFEMVALIVLRALEGLAQGVLFPSLFVMVSYWCPDSERGFLLGFIYSGMSLGTVASMTATGFICNSELLGGWPFAFYVMGAIGCIWFFVWCLVITDSPHTHPFITDTELIYITSDQRICNAKNLPPFPWFKVMTSLQFWTLVICEIGSGWGFFVMLNDLPIFFATILHFNMKENGFLSSFPLLLRIIIFMSAGTIGDLLIRKNIMNVQFIRKFSVFFSNVVSSLFLVGVWLAGCNVKLCVIFLMCFVMSYGFSSTGLTQVPIDLSPEYAGTIKGIINAIGSSMGFIAPQVIGILTDKEQTLTQWHIVFGISAVIEAVSGLFFLFFASSKKQDWLEDDKMSF